MKFPFDPLANPLECGVERRGEDDADQRGDHHAGEGGDADGAAAAGTGAGGDHQREDTEEEAPGGHQHRAIAEVGAAHRGFEDALAALALLFGELHHQNRILGGESDQHHHAELCVDA